MTRGRKKDLTIPPSKALTQQRDYRARKAQYVTDLERRCAMLAAENERLNKELEWARAGVPLPPAHPDTAEASEELMQHLAATSVSLARFQRLAFDNTPSTSTPSSFPISSSPLRPASFPSPTPSPPSAGLPLDVRNIRLPPIESFMNGPPPTPSTLLPTVTTIPSMSASNSTRTPSPSGSSESNCCGGLIDCDEFCREPAGEQAREPDGLPRFNRDVMDPPSRRP